jgi:hypothetical protein
VNAKETKMNANEVLSKAFLFAGSFFKVRSKVGDYENFFLKCPKERVVRYHKGKPPEGDNLEINPDGIFFSASSEGGWGFVVRDKDGEAVGAGAGKPNFLQDRMHKLASLAFMQY